MNLADFADLIAPPLLIVVLVSLVATIRADPRRYRAEVALESARARSNGDADEHRRRRRSRRH